MWMDLIDRSTECFCDDDELTNELNAAVEKNSHIYIYYLTLIYIK